MSSNLGRAQELRVTLLFICISQELSQAALHAADECEWTVSQAAFESYISSRRRPHWPETLRATDGCVALINFEEAQEEAAATAAYLKQVFGDRIVLIAVSRETETACVLTAMRAGCSEFLKATAELESIRNTFHMAEQTFGERTLAHRSEGSVLTLVGAKGGVGTTTLGVHLAVYLVQQYRKRVLLIDSKAQFGHVCIYLGVDGSTCHFGEVVSNVDRLDSELLKAFVGHHSSGLDLLSSPDVGKSARTMHADDVVAALDFLRSEYDLVIVDCTDASDSISRAVIGASSQVYLVATPDITAIRDLSRHVDDLSRLEISSQIKVVINRYSSQFAVSLEEIEKAIRMPISFSIPNNYIELVRSANLGEPVSSEGKSGFTLELLKWTQTLIGAPAAVNSEVGKVSTTSRLWSALKTSVSAASLPSPTGKRV